MMRRRTRRRIAILACGIALVFALALVAAIGLLRGARREQFGADHGRWLAIATQQAATFEAGIRQPVAAPSAGATAQIRATATIPPTSRARSTATASGTTRRDTPTVAPSPTAPPPPTPTVAALPTATVPASTATATAVAAPAVPPEETPETEPTAVPQPTDRVIAVREVNVRTGPGMAFPILDSLSPGAALRATGAAQTASGSVWRQFVLPDGRLGWILASLVGPLAP